MEFTQVQRQEADDTLTFMTAEERPYHTGPDRLGIVRLPDLDDGSPLSGLRVRASARGSGAGTVRPVHWHD